MRRASWSEDKKILIGKIPFEFPFKKKKNGKYARMKKTLNFSIVLVDVVVSIHALSKSVICSWGPKKKR